MARMTDPLEMLDTVAQRIRGAVTPHWGSGRALDGIAHSGDTTFKLDTLAEDAVADALQHVGYQGICYSEDRGLVSYGGGGDRLLVVDPVDGTRPAVAGFESACLSLALAEGDPSSTLGDVRWGWVEELKAPFAHYASRGGGAFTLNRTTGERTPCRSTMRSDLDQLFFSFELVARPAELVLGALSCLMNETTLDGGCFLFNSSSFSLTRLATAQLDAHIDIAARILRDVPGAQKRFLEAGRNRVITLFPYDIAAAQLVARETGCRVTDGWGESLDGFPLLPEEDHTRLSLLAASTEPLHERLLSRVRQGLETLR